MRKDLRELVVKGPLEEMTKSIEPITDEALSKGVEALNRAQRPDLARLLMPGMRRGVFDRVMSQVGTTQQSAPNAEVPTAPTRSPSSSIPPNLVAPIQTPGETLTEQSNIKNRSAATEEQSKTDMAAYSLAGESARNKMAIYDMMSAAASRIGPTGDWITPLRNQFSNLATLFKIENPQFKTSGDVIGKLQNQLAVEMTGQMKGQQSNRELEVALRSQPGLFATPQGMAILIAIGRDVARQNLARSQNAGQWLADRGSLYAKDENGDTFQKAWDKGLDAWYKKNGSLGDRAAAYFNADPKDILKGKITPLKAQ